MKLSRRELGAVLAGAAATADAGAQQAPDSPDQLLKAAAEDVRKNADAIRKLKVPRETEPAFAFRAL